MVWIDSSINDTAGEEWSNSWNGNDKRASGHCKIVIIGYGGECRLCFSVKKNDTNLSFRTK